MQALGPFGKPCCAVLRSPSRDGCRPGFDGQPKQSHSTSVGNQGAARYELLAGLGWLSASPTVDCQCNRNGAIVLQARKSKLVANKGMMSPVDLPGDNKPAAPRAGSDLRAARERLGWSVEEVSATLRIRLCYLVALEEGRTDLLPGNAYAIAFLRSYAQALGLDSEEVARRFKTEVGTATHRTELMFPAPVPQRGLPAGAMVLLGLILATVVYAAWFRLSENGKLPAETAAILPHQLPRLPVFMHSHDLHTPGENSGGAASLGQNSQPADASANSLPSTSAVTLPAAPHSSDAIGSASPQQFSIPPVPASSPTAAAAASMPTSVIVATPSPVAAPASSQDAGVVLRATADAWMEVRDRSGNGVLLNRVLHNGEVWSVPPRPNLVLTTGNAGGTELIVDGAVMQVPGGPGTVRRDLPLNPDEIKRGQLLVSSSSVSGRGAGDGQLNRPLQPDRVQPVGR